MLSFPPLRALAPAKINLGLFVGSRRGDGRHELVSVMQAISLADELTLEPVGERRQDELDCPGIEGPDGENLAMRALIAFRDATGWDVRVRLRVRKRVPVAAGLGGGSGDAAAVLRLAAIASGLGREELLLGLAGELGADVPAQVHPGRWLTEGAGERLTALPEISRGLGVLVLPARESLSTASVYAELDRAGSLRSLEELARIADAMKRTLKDGKALPPLRLLANDLQRSALTLCPAIGPALDRVRAAGADVAMLSGSGPAVLGLYGGPDGPVRARTAAATLADEGAPAQAAIPVGCSYGAPGRVGD